MCAKAYYKNAEHSVVSNRRGTPCGEMNYPTFIENCNEDTVFEMFQHLLPNEPNQQTNPRAGDKWISTISK